MGENTSMSKKKIVATDQSAISKALLYAGLKVKPNEFSKLGIKLISRFLFNLVDCIHLFLYLRVIFLKCSSEDFTFSGFKSG